MKNHPYNIRNTKFYIKMFSTTKSWMYNNIFKHPKGNYSRNILYSLEIYNDEYNLSYFPLIWSISCSRT